MCLKIVSKEKPKPKGYGYKVFEVRNGMLVGDYTAQCKSRPVGVWLKSENYTPTPDERAFLAPIEGKYPLGWHVFKTRKSAEAWMSGKISPSCIRKIKYRKAHTQGINRHKHNIVVAKEIYIIP